MDSTNVKYVVYVNGHQHGNMYPTKQLAENYLFTLLTSLPEQMRTSTEIRTITNDGRQVLFG